MKDIGRKNYYVLETLKNEITNFDIISFEIFDTILLYKVIDITYIYYFLDKFAEEKLGIKNFSYIRVQTEKNLQSKMSDNKVCIESIYQEIEKDTKIPCDILLDKEYELIKDNVIVNPYFNQIIKSIKNKLLWGINNSPYKTSFIEEILFNLGYKEFHKVFSYHEYNILQNNCIYDNIFRNENVTRKRLLHIGVNINTKEMVNENKVCILKYNSYIKSKEFILSHENLLDLNKDFSFYYSKTKQIVSLCEKIVIPNNDIAISVKDVGMMFNMSSEKVDTLKEFFIKLIKNKIKFKEFWALKNVNFDIKKGEKIGIIGLNGSGKSTLLKIISGVLEATTGKVQVNGLVAPLIELGAGFDLNLSAKENVYLNGAILGFNKKEIDEKYTDIIEFSELHEFTDVAIKNFSSGMIARLGFAIATCRVPDILIIDEILAVGDFAFQKKCHDKMKELTEKGATVLFVSHSASDIIEMCDKAIWIENGNIVNYGEAEYIVNQYTTN